MTTYQHPYYSEAPKPVQSSPLPRKATRKPVGRITAEPVIEVPCEVSVKWSPTSTVPFDKS